MPSNDSDDRAAVCAYVYSDGRTCRMLLASSRSQFCLFHERKLRNLREADYTAAEICEPLSHDFVPDCPHPISHSRFPRCLRFCTYRP
jgi:hypothetical protein